MDLSQLLKDYSSGYIELFGDHIPLTHLKVLKEIVTCRTKAKGGMTFLCEKCGEIKYSYHSCKNRHCPKCGGQDSALWLETQTTRLLPVSYHLTTFTIPCELRYLCRSNQKLFYSILFKASSDALNTLLSDPKYAGGCTGFIGILHTWSRTLDYHPHIHFVVPGGAYDIERNQWNKANGKFLVPVKALSLIFRAKFRDLLKTMDKKIFNSIPKRIWYQKEFVTNSIPVGKGKAVLKYLAEYVFRVAISNKRICSVKDGKVSFRYRPSGTKEYKIMSLDINEFIRRFLQHVLPDGFQKVRYYGFMSPAAKKTLKTLRCCLGLDNGKTCNDKNNNPETEKKSSKKEYLCPCCQTKMIQIDTIAPAQRAPPAFTRTKEYYINHILKNI